MQLEIEQIKFLQTQEFSSASNVAGESSDGPVSTPTTIDEKVIADEVLRVQRGHYKGVGCIVKGKRKALDTSYSTIASGSEQSQVAEDQRRLAERVNA